MGTKDKVNNITYNTYADVLCEAALPLFNYGVNEHDNQLSMLSLFSGCGGAFCKWYSSWNVKLINYMNMKNHNDDLTSTSIDT